MTPDDNIPFPASPAGGMPETIGSPTSPMAARANGGEKPGPLESAGPSGLQGETTQRFVRGAHEAVDRAAESLGPTVERMQGSLQAAAQSLDEMIETSRECVRTHPLSSVAVALAAGLLLGRLMAAR